MRASVLDGLSIGYVTRKTRPGAGRVARYLVQLDLREVSLVDEPSNDLARVELVKPADIAFENLRDAILAADTGAKHQSPTDIAFEKLRSAVLNTK
jgi:phage head maturation protease